MKEQMNTRPKDAIVVEQISSRRLTFAEFRDQVRRHIAALSATLETLKSVNELFKTLSKRRGLQVESITKPIVILAEQCNEFYDFIEQSTYLPISVVPLRLPIIIALKEEETQVKQINKIHAESHKILIIYTAQDIEQIQMFQGRLTEVIAGIEEIVTQTQLLLDRARFPYAQ